MEIVLIIYHVILLVIMAGFLSGNIEFKHEKKSRYFYFTYMVKDNNDIQYGNAWLESNIHPNHNNLSKHLSKMYDFDSELLVFTSIHEFENKIDYDNAINSFNDKIEKT